MKRRGSTFGILLFLAISLSSCNSNTAQTSQSPQPPADNNNPFQAATTGEPRDWNQAYDAAARLYSAAKYDEAVEMLERFRAEAKKAGANTPRLVDYLVLEGNALHSNRKFADTVKNNVEAAAVIDAIPAAHKPYPRVVFDCYGDLASAYFQTGNFAAADTYAKKAQAVVNNPKNKLGPELKKWISDIETGIQKAKAKASASKHK